MSRKSDPKASALAYFATVSLEEARDTLALVREVLRQRQPKTKAARKPKPPASSVTQTPLN